MSNQPNLTEEQTITNKAWMMFNSNLNTGLDWNDAKIETELDAEKLKATWDQNFDESQEHAELIWERSMQRFDALIQKIKQIP